MKRPCGVEFLPPVTVAVVRDERDADGRPFRVVALVDGEPVAYRTGRGRQWSCRLCGIPDGAKCAHVRMVRRALS